MKSLNIIYLVVFVSILFLFSCQEDDGISIPTACIDYKFYGLRIQNPNNPMNLELVTNSSASIGSAINSLQSIGITGPYVPNRATFDPSTSSYYFLNTWGSPASIISSTSLGVLSGPNTLIPTTSTYHGIVYFNGILYSLEQDATGGVYLVSVSLSGSTSRVTSVDLSGGINLIDLDAVSNKCFATENDGKLYFMSDGLIELDGSTGALLNSYTLPSPPAYKYIDITENHRDDINGLLVAKVDTSTGFNGVVHWELTGGTITEVDLINGLDFNRETTDLAMNTCGDRLLAISNYGFSGNATKVYDISVADNAHNTPNTGSLINTRLIPELVFGIAK